MQIFNLARVVKNLFKYCLIEVLMKSACSHSSSGGKFEDKNVSEFGFWKFWPSSFSDISWTIFYIRFFSHKVWFLATFNFWLWNFSFSPGGPYMTYSLSIFMIKSAFAFGKFKNSWFVVPAKNPVHFWKISSSFRLKKGINLHFELKVYSGRPYWL